MPISEATYFSYALPAMAGFVTALCWPIFSEKGSDQGNVLFSMLERARLILRKKYKAGVYLVIVGIFSFFVTNYLPASLRFVVVLLYWASFTGCLYIFFAERFKFRKVILFAFALFILYNAIQSAFFTEVAYMGITLFSFFFVGTKVAFWKKLTIFSLAVFMLIVIQGVKQNYRRITWEGNFEGNKISLFTDLVKQKFANTEDFFAKEAFFPIYYRANQGFNISLVMKRFPSFQPHDNGVNQLRSLAGALVPRFLWPEKPDAGGKFNMKYYTGITIEGWSTNVGPLGEAYGGFGVAGGIIFMFFLGMFIRSSYKIMFQLSRKKVPLLFLWTPVLFYQVTYSAEADTLQIMNSLFKAAFFMYLLYKMAPSWLGVIRQKYSPRRPAPSVNYLKPVT
ncbi:MAG: hypothetical protein H7Y31_11130 [Chitinophagaceae bacterium]|nr:hypothetical protein [Chitinophagaceae bacterium]